MYSVLKCFKFNSSEGRGPMLVYNTKGLSGLWVLSYVSLHNFHFGHLHASSKTNLKHTGNTGKIQEKYKGEKYMENTQRNTQKNT
jgi:hypothetical protein